MSADRQHQLACPACRHPNEPPFLFCTACGHPLLKLSHWRVTINGMLAFSIFLGGSLLRHYFNRIVVWDWPYFIFYAAFLMQVAFWLVRGVPGQRLTLTRWWLLTLAAFLAYFEYRNRIGEGIVFFTLSQLPEIGAEFPLIFYPALGAVLALILVPAMFRWARLYGWVNSYRIAAMTLILLSLAGIGFLKLADLVYTRGWWPAINADLADLLAARPAYNKELGLVALALGRLLLFEILIHASIKGYSTAARVRLKAPSRMGESPFVRALTVLAVQLRRLMLTVENMLVTLGRSFKILVIDLARVARTTMIEIILPTAAVLLAGWMLYLLTLSTREYLETGAEGAAIGLLCGLVGLILALNVFMGCKTPLRWVRLAANQGQLFSWLLPTMMMLFLLVSLVLAATAALLNEEGDELLPYRIGPITIGVGALFAVMVIVVITRKWAQIAPAADGATADNDGLATDDDDFQPIEPARERATLREKVEKVGWAGRLLENADKVGAVARSAGKGLSDRIAGRPALLDRLDAAAARRREKEAQIASLASLKASLDPETVQQLSLQYRSDLPPLVQEHERLLLEVHQRLTERLKEQGELVEQLERSKSRAGELRRLLEARVIDAANAKRQGRELKTQAETLQTRLQVCEQQIAFFQPALENHGEEQQK
jgi:hypothetical protein